MRALKGRQNWVWASVLCRSSGRKCPISRIYETVCSALAYPAEASGCLILRKYSQNLFLHFGEFVLGSLDFADLLFEAL